MSATIIKTNGLGRINAIRDVKVDSVSTKFAMVMPEGGRCTMAIRIGPNLTAEGNACFFVGDAVRYTMTQGVDGKPARVQDLVKSAVGSPTP